jgi:hypothetical protein
MESSAALAKKLSEASVRKAWDVYSAFQWPESLTGHEWMMSPELTSLHGTPLWDGLSEDQRRLLSKWEVGNFFSLVLQGERPLVQGLVHRLYSKRSPEAITEYLHHFVDEENKHMVMFGTFCRRYLGKVYPEKKIITPAKMTKEEEEIVFYCKVLVVEELGDYYNIFMQKDERLHPIVRELNRVHHIDESRHLAFGREHLRSLCRAYLAHASEQDRQEMGQWLLDYIASSWADYYNPTMYKDAGLPNGYELHQFVMASPVCAEQRRRVSQKMIELFIDCGLLKEAPELRWTS